MTPCIEKQNDIWF